MSWITETLTASNNIRDPFLKFLVRLFLLVVVLFALYIAFALVTRKKIIFNNGTYEIVDAKTVDSIAAVKDNSVKVKTVIPIEHKTVVIDTVYVKTPAETIHREIPESKNRPHKNSISYKSKSPTNEVMPNPSELTEKDKINITRKVTELQRSMTNQRTHISIFYTENEKNGTDCAYQLKSYLVEQGYDIDIHGAADNNHKDDIGFYIAGFFHPVNGDALIGIWVGILKVDERPYTIIPYPTK